MEEATYEGRPHFKIETKTATYYFDVAGGGLSRVLDLDGIDWVNYNGDPHAKVPSGASGGYRGIPNSVYRSDDGGSSHPGFDQCISEIINSNTITTRSKSGKWEWLWEFFDDHARFEVIKVDPDHPYWFLYEGVVGGDFNPYMKYWGTDLGGPRFETPSHNHGEGINEQWQWVYFGDKEQDRVFFVAQTPNDTLNDYFSYMGNTKEGRDAPDGMIVFGFGRQKGATPLMKETGVTFYMGFLERKIDSKEDHEWAAQQIKKIIGK
jgi:hypothetical protein